MKTEMLRTCIDPDTKSAFIHICDEIDLSPSQAIKLFAKAVINHGGIPFNVKTKQAIAKPWLQFNRLNDVAAILLRILAN